MAPPDPTDPNSPDPRNPATLNPDDVDESGSSEAPPRGAITLHPDITERFEVSPTRRTGRRTGSLLVIDGSPADVGVHATVNEDVIVGRDSDQGLLLRDGRISRHHARIFRDEGQWTITDLDSTNGTVVNGQEVAGRHALHDGDKIVLGSTVIKFSIVDETEAAYLDRISRLAGTDPLTGLHAKHRFDDMLAEAMRIAQVTQTPLVVMMMDMDGLKPINDTYGHTMGAHTIATVGKLIAKALGPRGEACRFGGDEFCAYASVELERGLRMAEAVRSSVEAERYMLGEVTVRATISIGIAALLHTDGPKTLPESPGQLVEAADEALYRAKSQGRNCIAR
ncbi:MAG: GGDEF domain-containing protein [Myxococcota bacterium]